MLPLDHERITTLAIVRYSLLVCECGRHPGLPDAFISVNIIESLGKQLTNPGEMVRGYAAIAVGYLTFNPIAKRQTLNMSVALYSTLQSTTSHFAIIAEKCDVISKLKCFLNFPPTA